MNYSNLNATLSIIDANINISNQALAEYFYKKSSVDFIKAIYEKVFLAQKELLLYECNNSMITNTLSIFNRILIEDSTVCSLNSKLSTEYEGCGGTGATSSLKINVIHELKSAAILKMTLFQGNVPDASLAGSILDEVQENDLILRDLGYFKLEAFENSWKKNAYLLSRFRSDIQVYLSSECTDLLDLGKYLKKTYNEVSNQPIDMIVYLGKAKRKFRLLAYKVPPEISNERRRKARKTARTKGRTPSEGHLNLCDYVILITNIPSDMISSEVIGTIYRIRWTIELLFKTWKSQLNLQLNLKGYKVTRIECFVYATLIICLLSTLIHGWVKKIAETMKKEISLDKLSKWLVSKQGYIRIFCGGVLKLEKELQKDIRKITTQKRKRRTTLERVLNLEGYIEKYVVNF